MPIPISKALISACPSRVVLVTASFSLEGFVYLLGASRRRDARLECADHEGVTWVRVLNLSHDEEEEEEFARSPLSEVHIDAALGWTARKLIFEDGTVFETSDHAGFSQLDAGSRGARLHQLERFGPHLVAFSIACLAAAYVLWRFGLDILAALAVAMTPSVVVEQIDRGTLQTIDYVMADPTGLSQEAQTRARMIYEQVISALPEQEREGRKFTVLFRDMPSVGPNAFALPGGTMVLTDDLVQNFANDNLLAGILGHEIGHVVGDHGLRRLYRSLGAYILVALLAGEPGPLMEDILLEGNALLSLSYSRKQETAADKFGVALSYKAGFDPKGLKSFFEKISETTGDAPQWMSSHPSHGNRIEAIDGFIDALPAR